MAENNQLHSINPSEVTFGKEDKIGEGTFGTVFKAIWRTSDGKELQVAAKQITDLDKDAEIRFLSAVRHNNIISYYGYYQEMTSLVMITELANGDLKTRLDESSYPLPQSLTERWIREGASGLQYLHQRGLVHRDIKTANYLLMEDNTLKLADFGLAKKLDETLSTLSKGTYRWMAPEVFVDLKRSKRSDVYSYGLVVWSIYTTESPFASRPSNYEIMNAVRDGKRPPIPTECPMRFRRVIESCWQSVYKNRPSMDAVLQYLNSEGDQASILEPKQDVVQPHMNFNEARSEKLETGSTAVSAENVASFFSKRADRRRQRRQDIDSASNNQQDTMTKESS